MAIQDDRAHDKKDLTVEHLARVEKGRNKTAIQVLNIVKACRQLQLAAESPTYYVSPDAWSEIFRTIRNEVDDAEHHLKRVEARRGRGRDPIVEWVDGRLRVD
jgi:hypothetical protein